MWANLLCVYVCVTKSVTLGTSACHAMLCYAMLYYAMLCYAMLMNSKIRSRLMKLSVHFNLHKPIFFKQNVHSD